MYLIDKNAIPCTLKTAFIIFDDLEESGVGPTLSNHLVEMHIATTAHFSVIVYPTEFNHSWNRNIVPNSSASWGALKS
mgnify:CR=1 FL=1